jgi:hypothetical protein
MSRKNFYSQESVPDLFFKLWAIRQNLFEIISIESEVKKLREHPIKDWYEWTGDLYYDVLNDSLLMKGHKEVLELFEDFKNTKNPKLKKLVIATKEISDQVVNFYVDPVFKVEYEKKHFINLEKTSKSEFKDILFYKNFK